MSRPLRIEFLGAVYHITARGNEKKAMSPNNKYICNEDINELDETALFSSREKLWN